MNQILTRLQDFVINNSPNFDKNEILMSRWGAKAVFEKQSASPTSIATQEILQKAMAAAGSTAKIMVTDDDDVIQITNVRQPITVTDSFATTRFYTLVFTLYNFGIIQYPTTHFNNYNSLQNEFNKKMRKRLQLLCTAIDNGCLAALEAAKTQVLNSTLGGRYSLVGNQIVAPAAEKDFVIGDIMPLMASNDFYGNFDIVGNPSVESMIGNVIDEQGLNQARNKSRQLAGKDFAFTNGLVDNIAHQATFFAVEEDSVAFVPQIDPDFQLRSRTHDRSWDIVANMPMLNLPMGVYTYDGAVDASASGLDLDGAATAHLTATKAQYSGYSMGLCYLVAYNSDPINKPSPIAKFVVER